MIRLFEHPLSSYCQKAKMAFYELGVPFETVMLDGSEPAASEFRALWPIGKFPLAVDGERVIPEATTIIDYLDAHHAGTMRLIPEGREAAIEVRQLDRFFDNYVQGPQQRIVAIAIGRDGGDEAALRGQMATAYAWLDEWLGTREWVAADAFSLADCAAAPALLYADWTHPIPADLTRVHAYRARLLARPSYARALDEARPYRHLFPLGAPEGRD
jgi:glutathione S-transferase